MIKLIRRLISMFAIISLCCCAAANASGDSAEEEQLIQILRNKKILSQGKDGEATSVDYYHNLNQLHRDNQKRTTQEKGTNAKIVHSPCFTILLPPGFIKYGSYDVGDYFVNDDTNQKVLIKKVESEEEISYNAFYEGLVSSGYERLESMEGREYSYIIGDKGTSAFAFLWFDDYTHYTINSGSEESRELVSWILYNIERNHDYVHFNGLAPTMEEAGFSYAVYCSRCFYILLGFEEISPLKDYNILYLPSKTKTIGEEAFMGTDCEAVIIPKGCTRIKAKAFSNCTNLKYAWIPNTLTEMGEDAFGNCPNVLFVYEEQ